MNGQIKAWSASRKVVVITGGNSGVGFALAQRLLALEITVTVCLACRNVTKAEKAKSELEEEYKGAKVDILQLDTSSIASVNAAAKELQKRHEMTAACQTF
ncbi:3-keto-steroid reductase [Holothuria leucospilota]|uniref:3-keto-steroid reductase n=1 Tax=Holothuria leucospilota TaxID=206669 RepID=A0A9Q1C5W7_HOLLE|nr:3-keto-steroid reductase [Holothuria leucospilota]